MTFVFYHEEPVLAIGYRLNISTRNIDVFCGASTGYAISSLLGHLKIFVWAFEWFSTETSSPTICFVYL
eukprot:CAMPEP_0170575124 /NCGR_PEP_ID=MMETSP0224-20130122/3684_1 /TAXON_ID=285029 /ORGANISM="Togula jolla, Strain CCCM 725" /LENGTH=68 /DNA_ID=CAMNT_0010897863 /DNA_START=544 /DNA_END=750 /DNA_ORIENTATION=-